MQDTETSLQVRRAGQSLHRAGTLQIPKKPPLQRPPKSPKRYSSASSSISAASPTQEVPNVPLYTPESTLSSQPSCSTSPVEIESYFDALSLQPVSPKEQLGLPAQPLKIPIQDDSSQSRPSFDRRVSLASSGCLSDEELATRAYAQRQTERRTSIVPLPSPDAPHSQRRRHRRRPPSSTSGLSSSQTSISSAAGSLHAPSDTESQGKESSSSLRPVQTQDLPLRWWHTQLDDQPKTHSPGSPAGRSTSQHPENARDSHASTSNSSFSRTRSSQATSLGPFDLDDDAVAGDVGRKERQLQRDFYDSIGPPASFTSNDSASRFSMPATPTSFSTTDPTDVSSLHSHRSLPSDGQDNRAPSFKHAEKDRTDKLPSWAIPIVRSSPFGAQSTGRRSFSSVAIPEPQVSTSNDHTDSSSRSPYDESARLLHSESRRTSASTTTRKRVGRIYSTSTVTSDLTYADELRTPRVSVSNQGRLADSIYSVASTASDIFPGMADTSKDLPAPPDEPKQGELGLGLGMESSRRLSLNQYAVVEDAGENDDTFIQPAASRFSAYSASTFSGADSPTEQSRDSLSLAETAYSNAFRNSVNSLASSLDLAPQTTTKGMTEDEKKKVKRAKIIEELVQTEEDYARDMALLRDVWLARARGKEMGEIMALLESYTWGASRPLSTSSSISNLVNNAEAPGIRLVERKSSAPQMQRNASQTSFRSFKGLVNSVGKNNQEKLPSVPTRDHGGRAASYSGAPRQRSLSNVQPLPPGAALYAPMRQVDVEVIFGNIEAVAAFSSQFAIILREEQSSEENGKGEARIGQAFLTMLHRLSTVYSAYCAHFGDAIQRWESISDSLLSYSQDCKDLCFGHTNAWDLPSLLIKPVQRCLKYPLFIQSLLDCTSDEHSDKSSLAESNVAILKVAEGINEMKRRHEIVTKLIKRKARPGLYGNTRRGSEKGQQPVKAPSSGSFTASLSRRFKRSSRIGLPDTSATVSVPEPDEDFEALLVLLESKHHRIQSFILDSKSWSKSVRTAMVSLLHVSLAWQNLSSLSEHDDTQEGSQSARTIGHFAASVVRPAVEDQWRDMDQEIRKVLVPKASQLLELFSSPRSAIATRYHRYSESRSKAASKNYVLLSEHAMAYHALNAQLKEELPVFLEGVEKIFTAIVQRFVTLQVAFSERLAEAWQDYVQSCCTQLGSPDQSAKESIGSWWKMHSTLAQQLDSLRILDADKVIEHIERRQRNSLPPGLRPRISSGHFVPVEKATKKQSGQRQREPSSEQAREASTTQAASTLARTSVGHASQTESANRSSTFSSVSAGSLSFSGRSSSSVTSPPTPSPGHPILWQGAVTTSFRPAGSEKTAKGYAYLSCEPGDLFDVLDEVSGEKYLLVRQEGLYGDIGWLPAHLLHKLE